MFKLSICLALVASCYAETYLRLVNSLPATSEPSDMEAKRLNDVRFHMDWAQPTLNFEIDGEDNYLPPFDVTEWHQVEAGEHRIVITTDAGEELLRLDCDEKIFLGEDTKNTISVVGSGVNDWELHVQTDDIEGMEFPEEEYACLRVAHFMQNVENIDVRVNGKMPFVNIAYGSYSPCLDVWSTAGLDRVLKLQVYPTDCNDRLIYKESVFAPSTTNTLFLMGDGNAGGKPNFNSIKNNCVVAADCAPDASLSCEGNAGDGFPAGCTANSNTCLCFCDDECHLTSDCCDDVCQFVPNQPECASACGDPHFKGVNGERFDVPGVAGQVYALLSDFDTHLNARYTEACRAHRTVIGEFGLTLENDNTLSFGEEGFFWNGDHVPAGVHSRNGVRVTVNDESAVVTTDRYRFMFVAQHSKHCNLFHADVHIETLDVNPAAHGIIGQTMRMQARSMDDYHLHRVRESDVLEGEEADYIVDHLFATEFAYGRFGSYEARDAALLNAAPKSTAFRLR